MTGSVIHPADLEPSLVDPHTYLTRRRLLRLDAATLLGLMLGLLTIIPARLIIPGTTDIGRPAIVVCLGLFAWWVIARLNPRLSLAGPNPIRWALLIYWLSILISYAMGFLRGLTVMEANSADRWLLYTAAFSGVVLAIADGMPNWDRLKFVLQVFVWCCVFMSVFGLIEAMLGKELTSYLVLPGLSEKGPPPPLQSRGGGLRVAATTSHYIELSAVLATALPFAIHFSRFASSPKARRRFALGSVFIGIGILTTISRTGIIAVIIAIMCLMPLWKWRLRYNIMVSTVMVFAALAAVKPSYATTILDMFTNISNDPSITSRTDRYGLIGYYFAQRPWLGRGTGTWVPPQYQYLDNQWLATALCNGIIGDAALAILFLTGLTLAIVALRRATTREDKHICAGLISTQINVMFVSATFDSLWFDTYATIVALSLGVCGAVWRFTHPARQVRTSVPRWWAQ